MLRSCIPTLFVILGHKEHLKTSKDLTAFKLVSTKHKVVLYLTFNISLLSYVLYDFVQEKNPSHLHTTLVSCKLRQLL